MQRASAAFGLLIFGLWLAVLAVGLAYVTAWAATQRRPQWRILRLFQPLSTESPRPRAAAPEISATARIVSLAAASARHARQLDPREHAGDSNVIPFDPEIVLRRRRRG